MLLYPGGLGQPSIYSQVPWKKAPLSRYALALDTQTLVWSLAT